MDNPHDPVQESFDFEKVGERWFAIAARLEKLPVGEGEGEGEEMLSVLDVTRDVSRADLARVLRGFERAARSHFEARSRAI